MSVLKAWKNTSWRSRTEGLREKLGKIQKEYNETQSMLASAQHDLTLAEKMGFADDQLPENYGELILERHPDSAAAAGLTASESKKAPGSSAK